MKKLVSLIVIILASIMALVSCNGPSWHATRDELCCSIIDSIIGVDGSAEIYIVNQYEYERHEITKIDDSIDLIRIGLNEPGDVLRITGTWTEIIVTIGTEEEANNVINLYDYTFGLVNVTVIGSGNTYNAVTSVLSDPNWN